MHKQLVTNTINIFYVNKFLCIFCFDKKILCIILKMVDFRETFRKCNRSPIFKIVLPYDTTGRQNCLKSN